MSSVDFFARSHRNARMCLCVRVRSRCTCADPCVCLCIEIFSLAPPIKSLLNVIATATALIHTEKIHTIKHPSSVVLILDCVLCSVSVCSVYARACVQIIMKFFSMYRHPNTCTHLCTSKNMQRSNRIKECMPYHTFIARREGVNGHSIDEIFKQKFCQRMIWTRTAPLARTVSV